MTELRDSALSDWVVGGLAHAGIRESRNSSQQLIRNEPQSHKEKGDLSFRLFVPR